MTTHGRAADVRIVDHGVRLEVGGSGWVLPSLSPKEATDLAAGLLQVAYGEDVVIALARCAEAINIGGSPEVALSPEVADALDEIIGRWRL